MKLPYFDRGNAIIGLLAVIAMVILFVGAWVTHVIVSIKTASWVLLVMGALVFPVGIIHGWAIWFGIL